MMRQQLQQLSKSELIEIILQQQTLIEQLQARVAELEEQIKRLTQPPKDATNSSVPPSKTRKPNRPGREPKKKRGPKQGHQGRSRKCQEPDEGGDYMLTTGRLQSRRRRTCGGYSSIPRARRGR